MFARSLYQSKVDKLVVEELKKIEIREKIVDEANGIYKTQTTQSKIDRLMEGDK